jgi:hypothetical protein
MKQIFDEHRFFYVDETGDPNFYAKGKKLIVGTEGCSRTFGVGFLRTFAPDPLRERLSDLRAQLATDRYLAQIPSMKKTAIAFHAKDDCPEVRKAVFELLNHSDFLVQIVIARKLEKVFVNKHKESQDAFYGDLTSHLFERQLHLASHNTIMFARRGDKAKQHALRSAVEVGIAAFRRKYQASAQTTIDVQTAYAAEEPLLQAADYALWAVQRAFERGEMRYFEYLSGKFEVVWDIYDFAKINAGEKVIYTRRNNQFEISKVSPLS